MLTTNFESAYQDIDKIRKSIINDGWRVGWEFFGVAWDKTIFDKSWTPKDTLRMVSSTLTIREREGGGFVVYIINEAKDPDTGVFYPRRVEFGISQRPQPWFFRAIIFAMANAEPEMRAAANRILKGQY